MKISVIVPVYNVQDYLSECVQSILNQTFSDFELLLIDDGSTDHSGEIADQLEDLDPRIQVYHKINGGLSDARNYGLERAQGEYLAFIDSDDYVAANYLETLINLIVEYSADASCLRIKETTKRNLAKADNTNGHSGQCSGIEAIENSLLRREFGISAGGKLFSGKNFSDIRFPVGELYEDFLTIPFIFERCKTVAYSDAELYFYYQRPGSITNSQITDKHMRYFDNAIALIKHLDRYGERLHDASVARVVGESINRFAEILLFCQDYDERIEEVRDKMDSYWKEVPGNPLIPMSTRVQVMVLKNSALLYHILFKPYKTIKNLAKGKRIK